MLLLTVTAVVAALMFVLVIASAVGASRFHSRYEREKVELLRRGTATPSLAIDSAATAVLPPPVRRYLEVTRSLDKPRFKVAILKQRGMLRAAANKPWMSFEAEQVYSLEPPGFVWLASARVAPLVQMLARDKFVDGRGNMLISLLGLFTIADGHGPEMDLGAGLRYWGEIIAFPETLRSAHLRWEPVSERQARLTIDQGSLHMAGVVEFNDEGFPIGIEADRYRDVNGTPVLTHWSGRSRDWKLVDGRLFPTNWESIWHLPEGDLTAVRMEILGIWTD